MQQTVWQDVVIQTLLTLKTQLFLYLSGMDSTNMNQVPCSILGSHSTQKHVNELLFLPKLLSESVTHKFSHTRT